MAPFFFNVASTIFGTLAAQQGQLLEGWGKYIEWYKFEEGMAVAKKKKKPAMVVISNANDKASKALRPRFANSKDIIKLSKDIIMINLEEGEDKGLNLAPDGMYVPRIVFLDLKGRIMTEIVNSQGCDQNRYYYNDAELIALSMMEAIEKGGQDKPKKNQR